MSGGYPRSKVPVFFCQFLSVYLRANVHGTLLSGLRSRRGEEMGQTLNCELELSLKVGLSSGFYPIIHNSRFDNHVKRESPKNSSFGQ